MSGEKSSDALGKIAWATVIGALAVVAGTAYDTLADPDVTPLLDGEERPLRFLYALLGSLVLLVAAMFAATNIEKGGPRTKSLLLVVWAVMLAKLEWFIGDLLPAPTPEWDNPLWWAPDPRSVAVFVPLFAVFAWVSLIVIGPLSGDGVRSKVVSAEHERWRVAPILIGGLMAAVLWAVISFGTLDFVLYGLTDALQQGRWPSWLGALPESAANGLGYLFSFDNPVTAHLPFVAAALLFAGWISFQVTVDASGVRVGFYRLRITLFNAPWKRVRRVDLITHTRRAPTAVIHYWSRFWLPFSFGVHGKHFAEPERVVGTVVRHAEERAVPIRSWRSSDAVVWAAYASILIAFALVIALQVWESRMYQWYLRDDFDLRDFGEVAGYVPLSALNGALLLFVGLGVGLLSAYHRGGPRPVLAALFVLAVFDLTGPVLHWLVWIAIHAIFLAIPQPLVPLGPVGFPPASEVDLAMTLMALRPAFVGIGYVLGVLLGCRRARPGEQEVGVLARLIPRQPTAEGAQRAG